MVVEIENFFGVYLLYCINPKYKGHTYIGFTVDPNRRVKQHNRGRHAGGARRTSGKGPWEMVLIIHGFPNQIAALRFEWAWQNPKNSRRLRHLVGKKKKETRYDFRLRIVSEMLRTGPWNRLPLTIRWLKQEYQRDFDPERQPPSHMPIAYGPVKSTKVSSPSKSNTADSRKADDMLEDVFALPSASQKHSRCAICLKKLGLEDNTLHCIVTKCKAISHTLCLAKHFLGLEKNQLIPVEGTCPKCKSPMLWGDLIRLKKGCYQHLNEDKSPEEL